LQFLTGADPRWAWQMRFARIPVRAASARELSARALRVLIAIAMHADVDGKAYPGLTRIAALAAIDRTKVPEAVRELTAVGLLKKRSRIDRHGDSDSNLYELVFEDADEGVPLLAPGVPASGSTGSPAGGDWGVPTVGTTGWSRPRDPNRPIQNRPFNRPAEQQRELHAGTI
jgi:hypothetical protein